MKNSKTLFQDFVKGILLPEEDQEEIAAMAYLVFEQILNLSKVDILTEKTVDVPASQQEKLMEVVERLNTNEPVQYILGGAEFRGRRFFVDPSVLIPRAETEELVEAVISSVRSKPSPRILDIGTGSGCIPVSLALDIKDAVLFAMDVSEAALRIARRNAENLGAHITFLHHDILGSDIPVQHLDVIVSNPPYIARSETKSMKKKVVAFEPPSALFVPDDDPLVFYKEIATKARKVLNAAGALYVEINERFGKETAQIFEDAAFRNVKVFQDISGKDRMVKGERAE